MAKRVGFSEARQSLSDLMELVHSRHEHVIISRNGRDEAVLMSPDEYESLIETLEILADPDAMAAIEESERDVRAGRVHTLEEVRRDLAKKRRR